MKTTRFARIAARAGMLSTAAMLLPTLAYARVGGPAADYFSFINTGIDWATQIIPAIGVLAVLGGLVMYGVGSGGEGLMKKVGPIVMVFGIAAVIASNSGILGVGGAAF